MATAISTNLPVSSSSSSSSPVELHEEVLAPGPPTAAAEAEPGPPRSVVVCAVDFSEHSRQAFEWCLENLFATDDRRKNDQLVLI
ncbi:hypothetical protein HK405_003125, partial [Cladochytrium tenue]